MKKLLDKKRFFKSGDLILIASLVLLSLVPLLLLTFGSDGAFASVNINGKITHYSLSEDRTENFRGLCTIIIEDGSIRVEDSECPDKLCEKTGAISNAGETIICIPGGLVIKIEGEGEVDAIAG